MTALHDAGEKWFNFGLQLGLSYELLTKIKNENHDDKMREVLQAKIKENSKFQWDTVVKALRDPTVDKKELADQIQKQYIESPTQPSGMS